MKLRAEDLRDAVIVRAMTPSGALDIALLRPEQTSRGLFVGDVIVEMGPRRRRERVRVSAPEFVGWLHGETPLRLGVGRYCFNMPSERA